MLTEGATGLEKSIRLPVTQEDRKLDLTRSVRSFVTMAAGAGGERAAAVSRFLAEHGCDRRVLDRAAAYGLAEGNPIC